MYSLEMFSNNANATITERITADNIQSAIATALTLLNAVNTAPVIPHDFRINKLTYAGEQP